MDFERAWEIIKDFGNGDTLDGMKKVQIIIDFGNKNKVEDWNKYLDLLKAYRIVENGMGKLLAPKK